MAVHVFVPRWMDRNDINAQNSNARALLSRFNRQDASWTAVCSERPDFPIQANGVRTIRLSRTRLWQARLALAYQSRYDAIFYPGPHWADKLGIQARSLTRARKPLILTIEGIVANIETVDRFSALTGHPVYAQPGTEQYVKRLRWLYKRADHIIAISPFLARFANFCYGDKVSCLPLGIDRSIFHSVGSQRPRRCRVVGCGSIKASKNPQAFLELAARLTEADFIWFGDGELLPTLNDEARRRRLNNLRFTKAVSPQVLADEFRRSSIFVLPSRAEGVPKVTQEAAACGLPVVLYGYFEAPSIVHEHNGFVSWSDEQFAAYVTSLVQNPQLRSEMGQRGEEMAAQWDWNKIAPQWESLIIRLASSA
ncbi:MAG TPA: glycosyltransferase [Terriglobales bacterium]|jgi:glycosyltransferase involved in cell wall biosynthesis|nr:glycosyltransferase [Terriglobales bacterium]